MGKITSIYLTDEEASELKKFCEANQCSQYSALKLALRDLLFNVENLPYTGKVEPDQEPKENSGLEKSPNSVKKTKGLLTKVLEELKKDQVI